MATKEIEPPATEAELTHLLERKYAKPGNGGSGEYAFLSQLRNDAGFSADRTFDGAAIQLWPSRGFTMHLFEVKVSKSDWKSELSKPDKAEDACKIADYFSIVAPRGIVDINDVPPTWGLIEAYGGKLVDGQVTGRKLRTVRSAPLLSAGRRTHFPAGLVISMLRAAGAVPDVITPTERMIRDAVDKAVEEERDRWRKARDADSHRYHDLLSILQKFEHAAGITIRKGWEPNIEANLDLAKRVREALSDDLAGDRVKKKLTDLRDELNRIVGDAA